MQQNRFKAFSDSENESDEEQQTQQKSNKAVDPRSRAEKRKEQKKQQDQKEALEQQALNQAQVQKDAKKQKSDRERQQPKGVSAEPHPLDKQSAQAFKSHDRKGGAGKGNWGTYKDDTKDIPVEGETEGQVAQQVVEVEEEQYTLQEYLAKTGISQKSAQQAQQQKGDQDYSTFLKEGCQLMEKTQEVDDKNPTKKKQINDKYIGMQNTDLLGFRTGLKTYALREERPEGERKERTERPQRQPKEETQKVEGEQQQTQTQTQTTQENLPTGEQKQENERKPYRNNREGGNRDGGNRDGGRQNRGGYKGGEKRGNRQQGAQKANVNLEDDSLFPKLG